MPVAAFDSAFRHRRGMSDALGINDNMMSLAAFPVIDDALDQHLLIAIMYRSGSRISFRRR